MSSAMMRPTSASEGADFRNHDLICARKNDDAELFTLQRSHCLRLNIFIIDSDIGVFHRATILAGSNIGFAGRTHCCSGFLSGTIPAALLKAARGTR